MNELINRIRKEHQEYLDRIAQLPPSAIIRKAYEICYREEFISILESTDFDDDTLDILLATDNLLDVLYDEWLDTDASVCDMLTDVIRTFVNGGN